MKPAFFNRRGFTLIEIVVAIFIFSVLFITLFGSFQTLSSSTDRLARGSVFFEMGSRCLTRISSDIESAYVSMPPMYKQPELRETADPYRVEGESEDIDGKTFSRIRFTSLSHYSFDFFQRQGVAQIVYYVDRTEDGRYLLRRSDGLYPFGEFEKKSSDPVVCTDIQEFSITYFGEEGEESEEWNSESDLFDFATPRSVQIDIQIGEEDAQTVFSTRIFIPVYRERPVSMT